jgi:hypothetical protein
VVARNLRLYLVYQACRNAYFFVPIFFLYFNQSVGVSDVLVLEAIYYVTVVVLEVPSGWFSDRVGRKATLLVSAVTLVASYAIFCVADSFVLLAAAQMAIAVSVAFNSGTDSAFLFDTLAAEGRAHEMGKMEGRAQAAGLVSYAVAGLAGGAVAAIDLRIPYALAGLAAIVGLGAALGFREPTARRSGAGSAKPSDGQWGPGESHSPGRGRAAPSRRAVLRAHESAPASHFRAVFSNLRDTALLWLFAFSIARFVFSHVPYEFFQPWLDLLFRSEGIEGTTPIAAGVLVSVAKLAAAFAALRAIDLGSRLGHRRALVLTLALYVLIIAPLGALLHPLVALAIALRGVPDAIAQPIVAQEVHPRLHSSIRATYLSVESLAGRLTWAGVLLLCSAFVGDFATLDFATLGTLLLVLGAACAIATSILALTSRALD